jgi:hypothetical protein
MLMVNTIDYVCNDGKLIVFYIVHNKIRVVRRQVANRRNSRLTRLLTAHKRQVNHRGPLSRGNSAGSLSKKVVEPYMKPVYGSMPETSLSTSPGTHTVGDENQPLLNNKH